jgi:hypothetical protein
MFSGPLRCRGDHEYVSPAAQAETVEGILAPHALREGAGDAGTPLARLASQPRPRSPFVPLWNKTAPASIMSAQAMPAS